MVEFVLISGIGVGVNVGDVTGGVTTGATGCVVLPQANTNVDKLIKHIIREQVLRAILAFFKRKFFIFIKFNF